MAFLFADYDNAGTGFGKAPKVATYRTTDLIAVVKGANYFDELSDGLETGDIIYVDSGDTDTFFNVTVDKAAGTVVLDKELALVTIT